MEPYLESSAACSFSLPIFFINSFTRIARRRSSSSSLSELSSKADLRRNSTPNTSYESFLPPPQDLGSWVSPKEVATSAPSGQGMTHQEPGTGVTSKQCCAESRSCRLVKDGLFRNFVTIVLHIANIKN